MSIVFLLQARVMKEFKKIDVNGTPLSKGYGFASFTKHEDALKALNELNNNPSIFTSLKVCMIFTCILNGILYLNGRLYLTQLLFMLKYIFIKICKLFYLL